jgi:uncharacterized RDD family membrane protein YckC
MMSSVPQPATILEGSPAAVLNPATFWQRLGAGLIDFLLTAAVVFSLGKICSNSKAVAEILTVPLAMASFLYTSIAHALYGRTVGKYILKIRVVRLNGSPIGWNESLRRSSVDGIFDALWAVGLVLAIVDLPSEAFRGQGWGSLYKLCLPLFPGYVSLSLQLSGYWYWGEFVTMLFNRRHRAVHDFLGSTMVIKLP